MAAIELGLAVLSTGKDWPSGWQFLLWLLFCAGLAGVAVKVIITWREQGKDDAASEAPPSPSRTFDLGNNSTVQGRKVSSSAHTFLKAGDNFDGKIDDLTHKPLHKEDEPEN